MYEERLPVQIDPVRLAESGRVLDGKLPISTMARLCELLVDDTGDVNVRLEFGIDHEGIYFLKGRIHSRVVLECQRCLQAMVYEIDSGILLGIVDSHEAAELLPSHYEPLVVRDGPLYLKDLIEDELLLSLPIVAMHPEAECAIGDKELKGERQDERNEAERKNPFSVLAGLKTK
jgi:uncharacterized protein